MFTFDETQSAAFFIFPLLVITLLVFTPASLTLRRTSLALKCCRFNRTHRLNMATGRTR